MNYKVKPITVAVGAVMTACLAGAAFADTEEDPFALEAAGDGYDLLAGDDAEGECGEGKCGDEGGETAATTAAMTLAPMTRATTVAMTRAMTAAMTLATTAATTRPKAKQATSEVLGAL